MKRLFIFLTLIFFKSEGRPFGPWLKNLTMHRLFHNNDSSKLIKRNPERKIYELHTLNQGYTSSCSRHAIKNVILVINALLKKGNARIKNHLQSIFSRWQFNRLNMFFCKYNNVKNINDMFKVSQVTNTLKSLKDGALKKKHPRVNKFLPGNIRQIMSQILTQNFAAFDPRALSMLKNKQYKSKYDLIKVLNGHVGGKQLLIKIRDFKKSNQQMLGIVLNRPNDDQLKLYTHAISVIINKINKNNFEFFVLDSANDAPGSDVWIHEVRFLKHLVNLPIATIEDILNSIFLDDWKY